MDPPVFQSDFSSHPKVWDTGPLLFVFSVRTLFHFRGEVLSFSSEQACSAIVLKHLNTRICILLLSSCMVGGFMESNHSIVFTALIEEENRLGEG